jgi:hypothetical protein
MNNDLENHSRKAMEVFDLSWKLQLPCCDWSAAAAVFEHF